MTAQNKRLRLRVRPIVLGLALILAGANVLLVPSHSFVAAASWAFGVTVGALSQWIVKR